MDKPYAFGTPLYWQSGIAAWQGDLAGATQLHRKAIAAGLFFGWLHLHPHADPIIRPLRDFAAFRRLTDPREST